MYLPLAPLEPRLQPGRNMPGASDPDLRAHFPWVNSSAACKQTEATFGVQSRKTTFMYVPSVQRCHKIHKVSQLEICVLLANTEPNKITPLRAVFMVRHHRWSPSQAANRWVSQQSSMYVTSTFLGQSRATKEATQERTKVKEHDPSVRYNVEAKINPAHSGKLPWPKELRNGDVNYLDIMDWGFGPSWTVFACVAFV